jgi:hypothetical protein
VTYTLLIAWEITPNCRLQYTGENDCLHLWTKETSAGDEIGWDFVSRVKRSRISFTSFCNEMTDTYKSNYLSSAKFMSRSTFVSWFFSWAATMNIDFRRSIDPWCGYSPNILACDGTHIGMSLRPRSKHDSMVATDELCANRQTG